MTKRMTKAQGDARRQEVFEQGSEHPRAAVLREQFEAEGCNLRSYSRSFMGFMKSDDDYMDNDLAWDAVARFIHTQVCNLSEDYRKAMMRLTLGDVASMWAKAAGGMCDVLDEHDGGTRMPDFKAMERAIRLILAIEANPDVNPEVVKLTETSRRQLRVAIGDWLEKEVTDG